MGDDNDQKDNAVSNFSVSRRTAWWGLTVFSAICVAARFSALGEMKDAGYTLTRDDKWTGSVMIISMCFAFIACCASHYLADKFVDQWAEGGTAIILLALWAAGMPYIMAPDNLQAVDGGGNILNANLYFFSWASLAAAVWICCSFVTIKHWLKRDDDSAAPPNMTKWYMLVAASFVVMTSSIRLFKADTNLCSVDSASTYCTRVKYALSLGAIGVALGIVDIVLSNHGKFTVYPEAGLVFVVFALYVAGIALNTFGGAKGPASNIGNLYFSTWIGFLMALFLMSKSWNAVRAEMKGEDAEEEAGEDVKAEEGEASDDVKKVEDAPPEAPVEIPA